MTLILYAALPTYACECVPKDVCLCVCISVCECADAAGEVNCSRLRRHSSAYVDLLRIRRVVYKHVQLAFGGRHPWAFSPFVWLPAWVEAGEPRRCIVGYCFITA